MLRAIIKTVTNRAALNWFRAPKCFNLWLPENFCLSQKIQESIDPKTWITYMGSKIDGPSGPRPRFFIVGLSHFQRGIGPYTWLACKTDISEEVRNHWSDVISWLFVVPRPHTLIFDHSFQCIYATGNNQNSHKSRCSELISGTKVLQFVTSWKIFVSHRKYRRASILRHRSHIWGPKLMVRVVPDHDFS